METLHENITKHPFFDGMKPDHLGILVVEAEEVQYRAGDILFREGEPASHFYLIQTGKIAVESRKPGGMAAVQTLTAGEVLGWSWLFPPFCWHFQARAVEPSHVIMLSGTHLLSAAERDHDFGYELMKRVSRLVISRLQSTRKLLLELQVQSALEG